MSNETDDKRKPLVFGYTNWRGEFSMRTVMPILVWWGSTEWHSEAQWLMRAYPEEKK